MKKPTPDRDELVIFRIRSRDSHCAECGEEIPPGGFLRKESERGLCLECADLGDLLFLPAGDPAVTRRATKYSRIRAVVVEWSRTRKRYERQGILVTADALEQAEKECLADAEVRERRQLRAAFRREELDAEYVREFARRIRERYPAAPESVETSIAEHACRKYSGRVGRSAAAKEFDPQIVELAVKAHIRHLHTRYDELLGRGLERAEARSAVKDDVEEIAAKWRG